MAFTKQQVDQDLLPCQSVTPRETQESANDPRDAVACERHQGHHGAAASTGRVRVRANPHALRQADVYGEEGVLRDSLERGVQQHTVFFGQLAGLDRFLTRLACLVLDRTGSPRAPSALRGPAAAAQGLVERQKLRSAQDAVSLPRPGSHSVTRWHV